MIHCNRLCSKQPKYFNYRNNVCDDCFNDGKYAYGYTCIQCILCKKSYVNIDANIKDCPRCSNKQKANQRKERKRLEELQKIQELQKYKNYNGKVNKSTRNY